MARLKTEQFSAFHEFLRNKSRTETTLADVLALAQIAARSMPLLFDDLDAATERELREIAGYIERLKREIGVLAADEIDTVRIPAAGRELGAVSKATEAATNAILESAEAAMAAGDRECASYKALIDRQMLIIFEACSFQDLTGQRIAKVMETLQRLDDLVSRFIGAISAKDADGDRLAREERRQRLLLNGPELDAPSTSQSDIDAMFSRPAGGRLKTDGRG